MRSPWFWFRLVSLTTTLALVWIVLASGVVVAWLVSQSFPEVMPRVLFSFLPRWAMPAGLGVGVSLWVLVVFSGAVARECMRNREDEVVRAQHWWGAAVTMAIVTAALGGGDVLEQWVGSGILGVLPGLIGGIFLAHRLEPFQARRFYSRRFLGLWRELEPDWDFVYGPSGTDGTGVPERDRRSGLRWRGPASR